MHYFQKELALSVLIMGSALLSGTGHGSELPQTRLRTELADVTPD